MSLLLMAASRLSHPFQKPLSLRDAAPLIHAPPLLSPWPGQASIHRPPSPWSLASFMAELLSTLKSSNNPSNSPSPPGELCPSSSLVEVLTSRTSDQKQNQQTKRTWLYLKTVKNLSATLVKEHQGALFSRYRRRHRDSPAAVL